jgi:hypothetical protein
VEHVRFSALGALIFLSTTVSFIAVALGANYVFFGDDALRTPAEEVVRVMICLAVGVSWALFVLNLLRLTVGLAGRRTDRLAFNFGDIFRAVGILLVTAAIALPSATPLQVIVTERDASARALAIRQVTYVSLERLSDSKRVDKLVIEPDTSFSLFSGLDPSVVPKGFFARIYLALDTNPGLCAAIFLGMWLLIALPPVIRLLTDRGAYDFLIEHRNRRWLAANGIEPDAYTIFTSGGEAVRRDAFHVARKHYRDREAQILGSRRYDTEVQRQIAIARLERIRNGQAPSSDMIMSVIARKKPSEVSVIFATERCEVTTLEGVVIAEVGDAIVTAKTGETWPVPRESFKLRYIAASNLDFGCAGTYYSKPVEVRATRLISTAHVEVARGCSELEGKPGDWLVAYGDGTNGVLSSEIFERTYEVVGDRDEIIC